MKALRITGIILFLLSAIAYSGLKGYESNSADMSGPEIIFRSESISVSVEDSEEELIQDVTAFDDKDGDVTDSILIENVSRFKENGSRIITYAAFDSSGHITKAERELVYTDYIPPRFALSKPLYFDVGDVDSILNYITAEDSIDGDISDKIKYEEQEFSMGELEGIYNVEFQVTNSAGDTAYLPTEVEFYYKAYQNEDMIPEIILNEYLIYIKVGDTIDSRSYLEGVRIGQEAYTFPNAISKKDITVVSNVNRNKPGVYNIEYSMITEAGYTGITKLIVIVEE